MSNTNYKEIDENYLIPDTDYTVTINFKTKLDIDIPFGCDDEAAFIEDYLMKLDPIYYGDMEDDYF